MRIYLRHVRWGGHCIDGVRDFIEMRGESWRGFFRGGLDETFFTESGDQQAVDFVNNIKRALGEGNGKET